MARARTNIEQMKLDLIRSLKLIEDVITQVVEQTDDNELEAAMAEVQTFCAVAIRVFAKTNPSKIRSEAMTVEIAHRLAGRPVIGE